MNPACSIPEEDESAARLVRELCADALLLHLLTHVPDGEHDKSADLPHPIPNSSVRELDPAEPAPTTRAPHR